MIKKWLIIVFSVFCSLTTFVVTFNIVQNNIILEKHKEFFNNYNDYKYKEYKIKKLGFYKGYWVLFFDEMDKEYYEVDLNNYQSNGQFCLYKNGIIYDNASDIISNEMKYENQYTIYYRFNKYKAHEYLLFKNKV